MAASGDKKAGDTSDIREWRSIVTLVLFVITNIIVLFPFHIPIFIPTALCKAISNALVAFRIVPPPSGDKQATDDPPQKLKLKGFRLFWFPLNFITAPLIADLFLLAISAIGATEVHDGTIGANHIHPLDIMLFFITLAYIAISIDASGLIRFLAFKVLQWGGQVGHKLFFYLYAFFFGLGSFIGNDPIILSGTAFLAYMTRVSKNIRHPKAWIYSQFAVANICSAILVSSNPTNLVLAGAFNIRFITYTANMIVPVVVTGIVLFPFLLYIVFADEDLIPATIDRFTLPEESLNKNPVNPNIPHAMREQKETTDGEPDERQNNIKSLEEILNPYLDKVSATFGSVVMAATLITVLSLNAASQATGEHPVFYITVPAAFVMFCWDIGFGWYNRKETREIARKDRIEAQQAREERATAELLERDLPGEVVADNGADPGVDSSVRMDDAHNEMTVPKLMVRGASPQPAAQSRTNAPASDTDMPPGDPAYVGEKGISNGSPVLESSSDGHDASNNSHVEDETDKRKPPPATLTSKASEAFQWLHETFPTVVAVFMHLPVALVPFAFAMFVLVQALASKGWITVFAHGWNHWVNKTHTVGAIGGMGFLSVVLCNFAGTNIGTTILLCRVIQAWVQINEENGTVITDRTFWATVYSMALGVNYGAFSIAFSASLAGLLWRDILYRKQIKVHARDFARVNFPIISISMAVGCAVLIGEVYIMRDESTYRQS